MIASVAFRNFKALRNTSLQLAPFNLVLGPNGSGKTSLIESLLQLRALSQLPIQTESSETSATDTPDIRFRFDEPHAKVEARLSCVSDVVCDALELSPSGYAQWPSLQAAISRVRSFNFEHAAIGAPALRSAGQRLAANGSNLAAVLAGWKQDAPETWTVFSNETIRLFPEFSRLDVAPRGDEFIALSFTLKSGEVVDGAALSQGMLYMLAMLSLSFAPSPPSMVCVEEIDRGIHPRMLREVRDAFYRLSYPESFGMTRPPTQVIATTHSPYLLDLLRDHPEEIVISHKTGTAAHFERLSERRDLAELLQEGSLGDIWFSGILGGVPEEKP